MIGAIARRPFAGIVLILGLHAIYMGAALAREASIGQARYSLPWVWPVMYAASGLACLWFNWHPQDRDWWSWSGALLGGAYVSRALIIVQAGIDQGWRYQYVIGAATWAAWAAVVGQLWLHQFRPASR